MKLTKTQAIENLYNIIKFGGLMMSAEYVESVRMATEAYEHEPGKDMGRYDPYTDSFVDDDCVSREAVTSTICRWGVSLEKNGICSVTTHAMKQTLANRIQKLPKVQPKVGWIPISKKLPEEVGNYLTSIRHYGEERFVQVSFFDGISFKAEVEAWMPLPDSFMESEG